MVEYAKDNGGRRGVLFLLQGVDGKSTTAHVLWVLSFTLVDNIGMKGRHRQSCGTVIAGSCRKV